MKAARTTGALNSRSLKNNGMKKYPGLFAFCFLAFSFHAQNWKSIPYSQLITFSLPEGFHRFDTAGVNALFYTDSLTGINYQFINVLDEGKQVDNVSSEAELEEFYESTLKGMLSRFPGAQIQQKEIKNMSGVKGFHVAVSGNMDGQPTSIETLLLLLNKNLVTFQIMSKERHKEKFDEYVSKIRFNTELINQTSGTSKAERIGQITGYGISGIAIIIIAVVLRRKREKEKQNSDQSGS
jgi:hypothetical protein